MSRAQSIADKYGCDMETAHRYVDLVEEGYTRHQALLMAGLIDPEPQPETNAMTDPFAKILIASDGAQVVVYKGHDDESEPALVLLTRCKHLTATLTYTYGSTAHLDKAFDAVDTRLINAVRAEAKQFDGATE